MRGAHGPLFDEVYQRGRPPVGGRWKVCSRVGRRSGGPPDERTRCQHATTLAALPLGRKRLLRGSVRHMPECSGPATVVFDQSLTEYDFGPEHPMSPLRVDLTMRLARELGVLGERLRVVPAPMASDDLIATVHTPDLIEAVVKAGSDPDRVRRRARPRQRRQPDLPRHAPGLRPRRRRERRGVPAGVERGVAARRQHHRRPAPRDARPGQRLLHLQRRRGRHPAACSTRAPSGSRTSTSTSTTATAWSGSSGTTRGC